jgi:peptidoglycan/LPS O-acetylase OafA/YrhL
MNEGVSEHRSTTLDALRGVAILMLLAHGLLAPAVGGLSQMLARPFRFAWCGVDLFFVLTGFLIGRIVIEQRNAPNFYPVFYARRALRILPLYALFIVVTMLNADWLTGTDFWPLVTFTQNILWAVSGAWAPGAIGITWSLAVAVQFYLVLPVLVRWSADRALAPALVAMIVLAPLCRVLALATLNPIAAYQLLPCRMDALFIGVLVAWIARQPDLMKSLKASRMLHYAAFALWCGLAVMAARGSGPLGIRMQTVGYSWIAATFGLTLLLIVLHGERIERARNVLLPLSWAGVVAYGLYLFHMPVLERLESVYFFAVRSPSIAALAAIVIAAVVAAPCWLLIERPLMALGRRRLRYS